MKVFICSSKRGLHQDVAMTRTKSQRLGGMRLLARQGQKISEMLVDASPLGSTAMEARRRNHTIVYSQADVLPAFVNMAPTDDERGTRRQSLMHREIT